MPITYGVEGILSMPENKEMRIMIVSTESSDHLKEEAKRIGIKAWLTKPYDDEDLIEVVKRLIGNE